MQIFITIISLVELIRASSGRISSTKNAINRKDKIVSPTKFGKINIVANQQKGKTIGQTNFLKAKPQIPELRNLKSARLQSFNLKSDCNDSTTTSNPAGTVFNNKISQKEQNKSVPTKRNQNLKELFGKKEVKISPIKNGIYSRKDFSDNKVKDTDRSYQLTKKPISFGQLKTRSEYYNFLDSSLEKIYSEINKNEKLNLQNNFDDEFLLDGIDDIYDVDSFPRPKFGTGCSKKSTSSGKLSSTTCNSNPSTRPNSRNNSTFDYEETLISDENLLDSLDIKQDFYNGVNSLNGNLKQSAVTSERNLAKNQIIPLKRKDNSSRSSIQLPLLSKLNLLKRRKELKEYKLRKNQTKEMAKPLNSDISSSIDLKTEEMKIQDKRLLFDRKMNALRKGHNIKDRNVHVIEPN